LLFPLFSILRASFFPHSQILKQRLPHPPEVSAYKFAGMRVKRRHEGATPCQSGHFGLRLLCEVNQAATIVQSLARAFSVLPLLDFIDIISRQRILLAFLSFLWGAFF